MGIYDVVENVYDVVTDAAGKVRNAAQVVEFVAKRTNLAAIADVAKSVGKSASPLHIAPTPVLVGGQKAIEGMLWTAGDGDPESGEAFGNSSRAFDDPKQSLADAHTNSSWEGGPAPAAYERRVGEQENRVATLADADSQVASVVSREAGELVETRRILNGLHNWLAEYGEYTQTLGVIPEVGKAIQMQAEMLAVSMALKDASTKMWEMHNNANANAAAVREALSMYQQVSAAATEQDSIGDFDPPH
jgi:EspA/EspE family